MKNFKKLTAVVLAVALLGSVICAIGASAASTFGDLGMEPQTATVWLNAYNLDGTPLTEIGTDFSEDPETELPKNAFMLEIGVDVPVGITGVDLDITWDPTLVEAIVCDGAENALEVPATDVPVISTNVNSVYNTNLLSQGWMKILRIAAASETWTAKGGSKLKPTYTQITSLPIAYIYFCPTEKAGNLNITSVFGPVGMIFSSDGHNPVLYDTTIHASLTYAVNGGAEVEPVRTLGAIHHAAHKSVRFGAQYNKPAGTVSDLGFLVMSKKNYDKTGADALTLELAETETKLTKISAQCISNWDPTKEFEDYSDFIFYASVKGITEAHWGDDIVARPYIVIDGEVTYGEQIVRNYTQVAEQRDSD